MTDKNKIIIDTYLSPCGELLLGSYEGKLCLCDWNVPDRREKTDKRIMAELDAEYMQGSSEVLQLAKGMLDEYFARQRRTFDIPLLFVGSDFQKQVWEALQGIPYGSSCSYRDLAASIDNPKAVRAVAAANGANAISIIVPCHRVIGTDGSLTGYAGGLQAKRFLLDLETGNKHLAL